MFQISLPYTMTLRHDFFEKGIGNESDYKYEIYYWMTPEHHNRPYYETLQLGPSKEINDWLVERSIDFSYIEINSYTTYENEPHSSNKLQYILEFVNETDAVAFKLAWL